MFLFKKRNRDEEKETRRRCATPALVAEFKKETNMSTRVLLSIYTQHHQGEGMVFNKR